MKQKKKDLKKERLNTNKHYGVLQAELSKAIRSEKSRINHSNTNTEKSDANTALKEFKATNIA